MANSHLQLNVQMQVFGTAQTWVRKVPGLPEHWNIDPQPLPPSFFLLEKVQTKVKQDSTNMNMLGPWHLVSGNLNTTRPEGTLTDRLDRPSFAAVVPAARKCTSELGSRRRLPLGGDARTLGDISADPDWEGTR
jgi:hypothetical protein